ncbi:hypothetical protein PDIDSM_3519 [Penicillium digitatum]|nr:hypothetical protein PDIDSM_3519 [Penicillium digitatum]
MYPGSRHNWCIIDDLPTAANGGLGSDSQHSDEQAIGINKDTDYGQSGAVHTNSMSVDDEPSIPRGGI